MLFKTREKYIGDLYSILNKSNIFTIRFYLHIYIITLIFHLVSPYNWYQQLFFMSRHSKQIAANFQQ